jgi:PPM family protein phosphatase
VPLVEKRHAQSMSGEYDLERVRRRSALSPLLQIEDFQPLSSTVRVEFGACSRARPGNAPNDDHYHVIRLGRSQETVLSSLAEADAQQRFVESAYAMLVADGSGDSESAGLAGRMAINALVHLVLHYGHWNMRVDARTAFEIIERLDWGYGKLDEVIKQRARANPQLQGMQTRLTAAYSAGEDLFVAHTGRSQAYIFRDGQLLHLTSDDPSPQTDTGTQGPRLVTQESQNLTTILSETIGGSGKLGVKIEQFRLRDADALMLCTDSLTAVLSDDQIADTLASRRRARTLCRTLVESALDARSPAHATVVLAQYRIPRVA